MDNIELMSAGSLVINKNTKAKIAQVTTPKIKDKIKIAHVMSASYDMKKALEGILKTIPFGFNNEFVELAKFAIKKSNGDIF